MKKIVEGNKVIAYDWRRKEWREGKILRRYKIKTIKCDIVDVKFGRPKFIKDRCDNKININEEWYKIWNVKQIKEIIT